MCINNGEMKKAVGYVRMSHRAGIKGIVIGGR
jgi:hypothetical protein